MPRIPMSELTQHVSTALQRGGISSTTADSTAQALVLAEAQGIASHGLSRVSQYLAHVKHNRVDGRAVAQVVKRRGATTVIDANAGLAFPACDLAIREGILLAKEHGISVTAVVNSHHAGVMADHLRMPAESGLVGLVFANAPAVMPTAGGRHPVFGTNPIAAMFPRRHETPLMIDMSLSEVTRGALMMAAKSGKEIPLGWAIDSQGEPTTDPNAAMKGSMLAIGAASSQKGALLAMIVELMASAVVGACFAFEASSFFVDEGNKPRIGQTFILIDPDALAGRDSFLDRIEVLVHELLRDEGVRLPGARREANLLKSRSEGIEVSENILKSLTET